MKKIKAVFDLLIALLLLLFLSFMFFVWPTARRMK
jgi:hypothetical protein